MTERTFEIPMHVTKVDDKYKFVINGFNNKEKKVYLNVDNTENPELLLITNLDIFELDLVQNLIHPIFEIEIDGKRYSLGERTLPVDGMNNFRDMGGYETYDGAYTKWGLLYRSDHIYNATDKGVDYLKKIGIHTIIDYRSENERSKYPNKIISNDIVTYCLDPDAHTAELAAQFTSNKENEDENLVNKIIDQKSKGAVVNQYDIVMEQYLNFVNKEQCKIAFSEMIKVAAKSGSAPIIQHCRGGKDRTGFGCMLLLGLLGVKKEYIIYDYMITHYNRIERNSIKMEKYKRFTQDKEVLDYLYSLIDTQPEFIEASYNAIIEKYGSIKEYAVQKLGITESEISNLKEMYLVR